MIKRFRSPLRQFESFYHENFQPEPEDLESRSKEKPTFRMLSIHSHNGCNLACKGCNHHSGVLAPGSGLSIDSLLQDLKVLLPRIDVWSHVSVLGGEALLEPRSHEVCKLLRDYYKGRCYIKIFSNALLIPQNTEWILDHMKEGGIFRISLHLSPLNKLGKKTYQYTWDFIERAEKENINLELLEISEPWDDWWFDMLQWKDNKFYPYEDGNIKKSFEYCTAPNLQVYSGKLWKCPSIAYLHETLASTGQLDDPVWQKYLNYQATPIDAPIEDLFAMAEEVLTPHEICNKCPSDPEWRRANKQLSNVKNRVFQNG
jgi:organic radical activating enzyme